MNEDHFFLSDDGTLWIVADGMGGQASGEIASALAVTAIVDSMNATSPSDDTAGGDRVARRLLRALANAQRTVLEYSTNHENCHGMGSAVLAGFLAGDALHLCHAGDVRCYVLSRGILEQVTRDHSWVARLVSSGLMSPEQARFHSGRGWLVQAVGLQQGFNPTLTCRTLLTNDRVLVCSDGLWEAVGHQEVAALLMSDASVQRIATALTDQANDRSGSDNVTVVVYQHE